MAKGHKGHAPGKGHDHEEHEEHVNHEAWVIPYADMLTLLMALFLVLFAIGRVDTEKFKKLAESLHQSIDGGASPKPSEVVELQPIATTDGGVMTSGGIFTQLRKLSDQAQGAEALQAQRDQAQEVAAETDQLRGLAQQLGSAAAQDGLSDRLTFRLEGRGLVVAISTDKVLFQSGRAELEQEGMALLDVVAEQIRSNDFEYSVEGHTDSRPISTARYPSNWELSGARAASVLRYLVDRHGFDPARVHVGGYGDTRPIAEGDTPEAQAKNRRVEIVILSKVTLVDDTSTNGSNTSGGTDGQEEAGAES
ncbi:MAG: OmpA family protein [Ilumatobacteraceae bacterium]